MCTKCSELNKDFWERWSKSKDCICFFFKVLFYFIIFNVHIIICLYQMSLYLHHFFSFFIFFYSHLSFYAVNCSIFLMNILLIYFVYFHFQFWNMLFNYRRKGFMLNVAVVYLQIFDLFTLTYDLLKIKSSYKIKPCV